MSSQESFLVAVAQAAPVAFDTQATLDKVDRICADAAQKQARLVLFPEAFIGGYPRGMGFSTTVGNRPPEGRSQFADYFKAAIDVPGPASVRLGEIAARHQLYLVIGVIERQGGTLYCTVLFYAPDGSYLGKHRKLMPTGAERLIWGFADGSTMPVFDTPLGRMGAVICWENYMPLMRAAHYAKGIQLYMAPTADGRDTWLATMRHVALEGRCFVLSANQFCRRSDYPDDYPSTFSDEPDQVLSRGGSCIISPLGEVLAGPDFDGEKVLTATVDLTDIVRAQYDFDAVGHYARPDVFQLTVNEQPANPVTFKRSMS